MSLKVPKSDLLTFALFSRDYEKDTSALYYWFGADTVEYHKLISSAIIVNHLYLLRREKIVSSFPIFQYFTFYILFEELQYNFKWFFFIVEFDLSFHYCYIIIGNETMHGRWPFFKNRY